MLNSNIQLNQLTVIQQRETDHGDGRSTVRTNTIVEADELGLTHSIAFYDGYLYASSSSTVYRWPYVPGQFSLVNASVETVITGMEEPGHTTRTLIFDATGRLYVSIGSNLNIDPNSSRARIRRFDLQSLPITFASGEVFADGVRNTVGLAFNSNGILFGVDNGPDMVLNLAQVSLELLTEKFDTNSSIDQIREVQFGQKIPVKVNIRFRFDHFI